MKNKKLVIGIIALVVVIALMAVAFVFLRPQGQEGTKSFTVIVTHGDGSQKEFQYTSDEEFLGTVILAEGLAVGEEGPYGLYIQSVDGEKAVYEEDGAYWSLTVNGEYATAGADMTPIEDGAVYALVYTRG